VAWTLPELEHWGFAADVPLPDLAWWLERTHPDDRELLAAFLDRARQGHPARWDLSRRFRRADGSWARVERSAMLVRDAGARCWCAMLVRDAGARCWCATLVRDAGARRWCATLRA